jgi:hypothetical protein
MAIMARCPNPECGADLMIPRRIGAHVICEECDIEWLVEDYDPVELVALDEEDDWDSDTDEEIEDDFDTPITNGNGRELLAGAPATTRAVAQSQWECSECGMLELGPRAPRKCSGCGASGDHFTLLATEDSDSFDEVEEEEEGF